MDFKEEEDRKRTIYVDEAGFLLLKDEKTGNYFALSPRDCFGKDVGTVTEVGKFELVY